MAIAYLSVKRALALRLSQIKGTSQSTLQSAYIGSFATALDGAEIPLAAFKDQILGIERELVQMIGDNEEHPARSLLYGRSADLANGASTPTVDNNSVEFFGIWDSVADGTNHRALTWMPSQTLQDYSDTFFTSTDLYNYNITGNQIFHTRSLAYLEGVVWDYTAQAIAYDADGNSPLPQGLYATWLDGVTARASQVGWVDSAGTFGYYNSLYEQGKAQFNAVSGSNMPLSSRANPAAG